MPHYVILVLYLKYTFSQFRTATTAHLPAGRTQLKGTSGYANSQDWAAVTISYPPTLAAMPQHSFPSGLHLPFLLTRTKLLMIKQNGRFETNFCTNIDFPPCDSISPQQS